MIITLTEVTTLREEPTPTTYPKNSLQLGENIDKLELELGDLKSQHRKAESLVEFKLKAAKDSLMEVLGP